MPHKEKVLCGLALNPGMSLKDGPEDEKMADEARPRKGFVPDEELGIEHALFGGLSMSQLQDCMDPLDFAVMKVDVKAYGPKPLGRNLRLI